MMALPVWKLSVDSQQPKLAPCTRAQSPWILTGVRLIAAAVPMRAHARRKTIVLRLH